MLTKLIAQLNKDLSLSGIETQFNLNWSPAMLIDNLNEIVSTLMENDFQKFTNLLYRIDVSEKKIRDIGTSDLEVMVSKLTLMILQKEWQKVWFRNRNSLQE